MVMVNLHVKWIVYNMLSFEEDNDNIPHNGRIQRHKRQSALRVIPWILAPHIMVIATVADDIRKRSNKKNAE